MSQNDDSQQQAQGEGTSPSIAPIFADATQDFAEHFKDRVRCLFEKFDADGDGFLNFSELGALQKATDGTTMSEQNYVMACKALSCDPRQGVPLPALKLTYMAEGANLEKDYYKVFPDEMPDDYVFEAGEDGFDIS